jgi:hypothetical protein
MNNSRKDAVNSLMKLAQKQKLSSYVSKEKDSANKEASNPQ